MIRIPKENREEIVQSLQDYFYNELSEEIGNLAAENLLDFILKEIGPYCYNQGVNDAKVMVEQKILSLEEDILSLEIPTRKNRN
ncbi:hypothetical protein GCM10010978_29320 [Compostibacillus humi]|uniref:DUF2164 domain-containing protein n=1 Tax=Compostibacillus humi TaxID=1245525 RepID=A0A8J2TTD0_9BACI|nr:DUF2164 domain-containing protein [Compostibacillus humi]GFZ87657.1 hypothetical protein GCM10010978_29320 [Compostibacillus humi]HLT56906.1 DUF2164 domain-containing protein [Bacillota bacterium]